MRKFTMWLAAAILLAGILTTRVSRSAADGPIQGDWSAKVLSRGETACMDLELERSTWGHHQTWGNTHKISDFYGLDANLASQGIVHARQRPVLAPLAEILVDGLPGRVVLGQHPPRAASAE